MVTVHSRQHEGRTLREFTNRWDRWFEFVDKLPEDEENPNPDNLETDDLDFEYLLEQQL